MTDIQVAKKLEQILKVGQGAKKLNDYKPLITSGLNKLIKKLRKQYEQDTADGSGGTVRDDMKD